MVRFGFVLGMVRAVKRSKTSSFVKKDVREIYVVLNDVFNLPLISFLS